jgi:signal transduction histidine kinase
MVAELTAPQLSLRTQRAAQVSWVVVTLLALAFFLLETSLSFGTLRQPSLSLEEGLARHGLSVQFYAVYMVGLRTLYMLVHLVIASLIIFKRPGERFAVFVSFFLVIMGTTFWPLSKMAIEQPAFWHWPRALASLLMSSSLLIFFLTFPDGRFIPRWTKPVSVLMIGLLLLENFFPQSRLSPGNWNTPLSTVFSLFTLGVMIYAPVYRYRKFSNTVLRQQTRWVVYGVSIALIGFFIFSLFVTNGVPLLSTAGLLLISGMMLALLLIPLSIGIAILRFRLWNIDPIINRTLVYGTLSFLTILFYVLIVGVFAYYFRSNETNIVISFIATGIVAILFEPLRQRLQRAVNRLMYGERDDPATVLTRLSQRLESALAPESVLQTIVETLAQTMRLPYAALSILSEDGHSRLVAGFRQPPPSELIYLPLTYQAQRVGELILAPRALGEAFSPADMRLINIIAQQAGVAAYTLRLNSELQQSRERLVTAREEERRRLRRDLHDGIGPTLASLSQRLDTAADLVQSDPHASMELLKALKGQVKNTVAEIRRLVYALRPPVLDEFGLVTAVREHIAQYGGPNGIEINFDSTKPMPPLPAAVEVAAYRIVLEAFTNIIHHAQATTCHILLQAEQDCLRLEVSDNGIGLPEDVRSGVGFTSMRERALELGGDFAVENTLNGGLRVTARLPLEGG